MKCKFISPRNFLTVVAKIIPLCLTFLPLKAQTDCYYTTEWATWETYTYMKVLDGDFNGDGKDDVMKFDVPRTGISQGGLWVGLSDGTRFNTTQWATWDTYIAMKVLTGDFNGDGKDDVMKFDVPATGTSQLGLWVGLSDGNRFNTSQWATWDTYINIKVLVGDFNGDGKDDVMKFDVPSTGITQGGLWVGLSDGTRFNTSQWATWDTYVSMKVLAGDFNGDGKDDIIKFDIPSTGSSQGGLWVGLSDGTRFNTSQWAIWDTYINMKVLMGDFNGDGKDDVMKFDIPAAGKSQGGLWVGLSDGARFNTTQWATWETYTNMKVLMGDFNGDNKDDVMKFDVPYILKADGGLWAGISNGTQYNTSQWDTWETYNDMKVLAGDFNGDGTDDVMKLDVPFSGKAEGGLWVGIASNTLCCEPAIIGSLPVPLHPQETGMWCWAASGQMIMDYMGHNVSQCIQANNYFGHDDCCNIDLCPPPTEPAGHPCVSGGWPEFEKYGFTYKRTMGAALTWNQVISQTSNEPYCSGKPFAFTWAWAGGGGHMMVCKGYVTLNNINYIVVNDPSPPCQGDEVIITYDRYVGSPNNYTHWDDFYDITYIGE